MSGPAPGGTVVPAPRLRWGTRVLLPAGILTAFAVLFGGSVASSLAPLAVVEVMPVVERPAITRPASPERASAAGVVVQAAGWIEPSPYAIPAVALIDGTVEEVHFLEGDRVGKGYILARLVGEDARLALRRAEAEARAAEEAWEANIDARRDAAVAAAIVREKAASLELARAELDAGMALLREAERIHERRASLHENDSVSREEYETAAAAAETQGARVRVLERRIEELEAQLDRAGEEEAAANRRLELRTEERRRLELARVALEEARLRVERLAIRAPINGVVMERRVEPGSMVASISDDPEMSLVARLYDPETLQVRVDVPLAEAARIGVGQRADVLVEVLADRTFSGEVTRIMHRADIQKNTLEVKVALHEPAAELRPEMLARVRFLARQRQEASPGRLPSGNLSVFAPAAALRGGAAWVVTGFDGERGILARRAVAVTGAEDGGWLETSSGLQPGDLLVVSPTASLRPGQHVQVRRKESEQTDATH